MGLCYISALLSTLRNKHDHSTLMVMVKKKVDLKDPNKNLIFTNSYILCTKLCVKPTDINQCRKWP